MAARVTFERILRDDDDATGQTIRDWKIEAESGFIKVCLKHGDGFILLRMEDVPAFIVDLHRAKDAAITLSKEK